MSEIDSTVGERSDDGFVRLYEREFVRAARLAHLLTGSNAAAEDIAQEAMLKVGPRVAALDDPSRYLTTTVVNLCRNWHRSRGREAARVERSAPSQAAEAAGGPSPHDGLLDVVDRLPFRQRTVLVARYWLDLSEADIAQVLGCRPGTVKSLAARAMDTLRHDLREELT